MTNFPWNEFYERYIINGEEFSFIYKDDYRIYLSNDSEMNAVISLVVYSPKTKKTIDDLLNFFGLNKINLATLGYCNNDDYDKNLNWNSVDEEDIKKKLYLGTTRIFLKNNSEIIELYSYYTKQNIKAIGISKTYKSRELLLINLRIDGKNFEEIYNDLISKVK